MSKRNYLILGILVILILFAVILMSQGEDLKGTITGDETPERNLPTDTPTNPAQPTSTRPPEVLPATPTSEALIDDGDNPPGEPTSTPADDVGGAGDSPTSIPPTAPAPTFPPPPVTEIAEVGEPVEVALQGVDGVLGLFHPDVMELDEVAQIRLEIEITDEQPLIVTLIGPAPTETPNLNPDAPTLTPISLEPQTGFIAVYDEMQAFLRGVDIDNFKVDAIPADGMRHIEDQLTTWTWVIKPNGEAALGRNHFQVVIFVPELNRETSTLPFSIDVHDPREPLIARKDGDGGGSPATVIGGIVAAILLLGVGGYTGYRWYQKQRDMVKVFISYRREDSQGSAGRIYDRLIAEFGKDDVFMDVSTIEYGVNFAATLEQAIAVSDVVIALIGKQWATITDDQGNRRLDNPQDFVRREIATALQQGKRVIPALVNEAEMPSNDQLPDDLRALGLHNAIRIHNDSFDQDVKRLIEALRRSGSTGPFELK